MARPKKPVADLQAKGTFRKDRHAERVNELAVSAGPMGAAPQWFTEDALSEWELLTGHPAYAKVLNPLHRGTLIEYCYLYGVMIDAAKGLGEISASQRQTLNSLRMQLGITPASQTKVKVPETKPVESKWGATKPIHIVNQG